jgi:hypothetical protein
MFKLLGRRKRLSTSYEQTCPRLAGIRSGSPDVKRPAAICLGPKIAYLLGMDFWDLGDHVPDDSLRRPGPSALTPHIVRLHEDEEALPDSRPSGLPSREVDNVRKPRIRVITDRQEPQ